MPVLSPRGRTLLAAAVIVLAPLLLLAPCVFGKRTFVPFDLAQFAPAKCKLTAAELAAVTAGQNTDVSEIPFTFVPELRYAQDELRAGRLPEWNNYARFGAPLLATAVVGLLYPPNWIYLAVEDPAAGLVFGAWFSLAVGGLLMLGFLRSQQLSVAAAVFGALALQYSGTLSANAHFYQRLAALVWLPGMLWALHGIFAVRGRARAGPTAGLAACLALAWLAGFPSYAAPATLIAGIWGAHLTLRSLRSGGVRPAGSAVLASLGAVGLGFLLASVQLVPMFAFFPESNRTVAPPPNALASEAFDPAGWLGYLLPDLFGHTTLTGQLAYDATPLGLCTFTRARWVTDADGPAGQLFFPLGFNSTEYQVFPGTLVLLLALLGACQRHRLRSPTVLGLSALLILGAGFAALATIHQLPLVRNVPPKRFVGPACALVAVLAAVGFDRLRDRGKRTPWNLPLLAAALAAACAAAWLWLDQQPATALQSLVREHVFERFRVGRSIQIETADAVLAPNMTAARALLLDNLRYGGVAFALAALGLLAWRFVKGRAGALGLLAVLATLGELLALAHAVSAGRELAVAQDTAVHAFLREQRDRHSNTGGFTVARGVVGGPQLPVTLPPCTLVPERIRDLNIYTFVDSRSHRLLAELYGAQQMFRDYWVHALPDDPRLKHPLLDLLGVRFVIAEQPLQHAGLAVGPDWRGPHGEVLVYERPGALPRAFTVPARRELGDDTAIVKALVANDLDPWAAVLMTPDAAERLGQAPPDPTPWNRREVRFVKDDPNDIVLHVDPGPACALVLADNAMSGWTATIDGTPAPIARGNLWMRVVQLPANGREVRFRYRTPGLDRGAAISAAASVVWIALLLVGARSRRRHAMASQA